MLKNLNRIVKPEEQWPDPLPRPCHMVAAADEPALRKKLVGCGLASLIEEKEVPVCRRGRKLLAGLFTVPHKAESDRLIIDRRPQNETEERLCWVTLPHGSQFSCMRLRPNQHMRPVQLLRQRGSNTRRRHRLGGGDAAR